MAVKIQKITVTFNDTEVDIQDMTKEQYEQFLDMMQHLRVVFLTKEGKLSKLGTTMVRSNYN